MSGIASITTSTSSFGQWATDQFAMRAFTLQWRERPEMFHQIGSRRFNAVANQHGQVRILTAERGVCILNSSDRPDVIGGIGEVFQNGNQLPVSERKILLGRGYVQYVRKMDGISVEDIFFAPFENSTFLLHKVRIHADRLMEIRYREKWGVNPCCWTGRKCSYDIFQPRKNIRAARPNSAFAPWIALGLISDNPAHCCEDSSSGLCFDSHIALEKDQTIDLAFAYGYGESEEEITEGIGQLANAGAAELLNRTVRFWKNFFRVDLPGEYEIAQEMIWNAYYVLSGTLYDRSRDCHFVFGGPMYWGITGIPQSGGMQTRDILNVSLPLIYIAPDVAKQCLRFVLMNQGRDGAIRRVSYPGMDDPGDKALRLPKDSCSELALLFFLAEYVCGAGEQGFLDEIVTFNDGKEGTVEDHVVAAVDYIINVIALGSHDLIRMLGGDWNDTLNAVGAGGTGESVLNSELFVYAWSRVRPILHNRSNGELVARADAFAQKVRRSLDKQFDGKWFIRAYTDDGTPVGDCASDQLFINTQSFAAICGCGTRGQRLTALREAMARTLTPLGPTLMSKPFPNPPDPRISSCAFRSGEGENAGIWPNTGSWLAWALSCEGLNAEAADVFRQSTLFTHARLFPEIWYGQWITPDCFNGPASTDYGATQKEGWDRTGYPNAYDLISWHTWLFLRFFFTPEVGALIPSATPAFTDASILTPSVEIVADAGNVRLNRRDRT